MMKGGIEVNWIVLSIGEREKREERKEKRFKVSDGSLLDGH